MIRINLNRLTECNQCERPVPLENNAKMNHDESDQAQLCGRCERTLKAEAHFMLSGEGALA